MQSKTHKHIIKLIMMVSTNGFDILFFYSLIIFVFYLKISFIAIKCAGGCIVVLNINYQVLANSD